VLSRHDVFLVRLLCPEASNFSNITIRARLALAMGFLGLLMTIGAVLGVTGIAMSNADQKELYSNELASAIAIGKFNFFYARGRLVLDWVAVQPDHPDAFGGKFSLVRRPVSPLLPWVYLPLWYR
jgi:hypothetical protein